MFYISTNNKLGISLFFSLIWMLFSYYMAEDWIYDLTKYYSPIWAYCLVFGIAIIPGFFNTFLVVSLLLDKRPKTSKAFIENYPPISILIAAYNEESCIKDTLLSLIKQDYNGEVEVIVCDDGSTDTTIEKVNEFLNENYILPNFDIKVSKAIKNQGKSYALNRGLDECSHRLVITVDADSYLFKDAIKNMVLNYVNGPKNTGAIAGTVLVRNSRKNWLTRLQEWEYFISISQVKRTQSLYQGTLVAQGAFSLYRKSLLKKLGGWPHVVGEDIVLTWGIHRLGYRVGHAEDAIVFTNVPEEYSIYYKQRKRWSRGLIEAFKQYPSTIWSLKPNSVFIWLNLMFPFLDFMFIFGFIPGLIFALAFQWYEIVSILTIILLPMAILLNYIIYRINVKTFEELNLKVRKNILGYIVFMLFNQLLLSPACLSGYIDEFINKKKTWGTKSVKEKKPIRLENILQQALCTSIVALVIIGNVLIYPFMLMV